MTAAFRLDEQVTIEKRTGARDNGWNTEVETADGWTVVVDHEWANTQDVLPSRGEATANGLVTAVTRTRLRMQVNDIITTAMRVTLHDKGGRLMQIVAGPALLDDRRHVEFMLEGFSS